MTRSPDLMWLRFILSIAAVVSTCGSLSVQQTKTTDPPKECAKDQIEKYGKPVMFERHAGVAFGVSAPLTTYARDDEAKVYVWLSNQSQSSYDYSMCCERTFLKQIEVFDASGARLDSVWDVEMRNWRDKHENPVEVCSCSYVTIVTPGSCIVVDQGTVNRRNTAYDLPPGRYTITDRLPTQDYRQSRPPEGNRKTVTGVAIVIEDR